jgi:hypothetical protein
LQSLLLHNKVVAESRVLLVPAPRCLLIKDYILRDHETSCRSFIEVPGLGTPLIANEDNRQSVVFELA